MKERLTGAIILVALLVLLVPELLTGPSSKSPASPAGPEGARLRTYTIDLADDSVDRPPPTAPTTEASDEPVAQAKPDAESGSDISDEPSVPVDETAAAAVTEPPRGSGADPSAAGPAARPDSGTAASPEPERPRSAFGPNAMSRVPAGGEKPAPAKSAPAQPEAPKSQAAKVEAARAEAAKPELVKADSVRSDTAKADAAKTPPPKADAAKPSPPKGETAAAEVSRPGPAKGWAVQLGVFASRDNAERLAKQLRGKGYPVVINEIAGNGKRLYRVRVGPEAERDAAVALGAKLRAAGHAGSVVGYP